LPRDPVAIAKTGWLAFSRPTTALYCESCQIGEVSFFLDQPYRSLIEIKEAGIFSTNRSAAQRSVRIEEVGFVLDQPQRLIIFQAFSAIK
jgi:hypothetical protein